MKQGFTLLELSIVLVIIGLITGGVIAGTELINQAKLGSIVTEHSGYTVAIRTFKMKYGALPGDLSNAKSYWPDDSRFSGFTVRNGNGSGRIDDTAASDTEAVDAWEHLSLSEIIPGYYNGNWGSAREIGINFPGSDGADNGFYYVGWYPGDRYEHLFLRGNASGGYGVIEDILTPADARAVDNKADDGLPETGKVEAYSAAGNTCHTAGEYVLSTDTKVCSLSLSLN